MTKIKKRLRPIPPDYQDRILDIVFKAKKRTVNLFDVCLKSYCLDSDDHNDFLEDIMKAIDFVPLPTLVLSSIGISDSNIDIQESSIHKENIQERRHSRRLGMLCNAENKTSIKSDQASKLDEHNEVCEICEVGGDLLCCSTCSLVFHLKCLRPKISSIPKGEWSCAYCIVDGIGSGDVRCAKKSIRLMKALSSGLETASSNSPDEREVSQALDDEKESNAVRGSRTQGLTIERAITNNCLVIKDKTAELGRFETLDAALNALSRILTASTSDKEEVWCTCCLDDKEQTICVFCGCQVCFGKQDSDYLLICDGCDLEYHTYCLTPQLTEVPPSRWYCCYCVAKDAERLDRTAEVRRVGRPKGTSSLQRPQPDPADPPRLRGRPPGRKNNSTLLNSRLTEERQECSVTECDPPDPTDSAKPSAETTDIGRALIVVQQFGRSPLSEEQRNTLTQFRAAAPRWALQEVLGALLLRRAVLERSMNKGSVGQATEEGV